MTRWQVMLYLAGAGDLELEMARTLLVLEAADPPAEVDVTIMATTECDIDAVICGTAGSGACPQQ